MIVNKLRYPFGINQASCQAPGLIFWGPGDVGGGTLANAVPRYIKSGTTYNGTVPTGGKWVPGVDGGKGALVYDGSTTRVALDNSNGLPATAKLSVSCWVKTSTTARYQYVFVKWGVLANSDSWQLRIDAATGFVYWTLSTNGAYQAPNDLNGTSNVADGKWHLIVATYDGATSRVYVDGKLENSVSVSGALFAGTSDVNFGGLSDGGLTTNWLIGSIDDPRIYNIALPLAVIKSMYNPSTRWELRRRPRRYTGAGSGSILRLRARAMSGGFTEMDL